MLQRARGPLSAVIDVRCCGQEHDVAGNGVLTFEEFKAAVYAHPLLLAAPKGFVTHSAKSVLGAPSPKSNS